jgi:hypothetical protein
MAKSILSGEPLHVLNIERHLNYGGYTFKLNYCETNAMLVAPPVKDVGDPDDDVYLNMGTIQAPDGDAGQPGDANGNADHAGNAGIRSLRGSPGRWRQRRRCGRSGR